MMFKRGFLGLILLAPLLLTAGCGGATGLAGAFPGKPRAEGNTVTIYAAASLTESFQALGDAFSKEGGQVTVLFNFAGSQRLAQQLTNGAPGDLFASADERQMRVAVEGGRIDEESVQIFAHNSLAVVVPQGNPGNLSGFEDLADPGLRLVLATPEVPVGHYTRQFLQKASRPEWLGPGFQEDVLANVSSLELNVRAVLTKVSLAEADAGIVYASDVIGKADANVETLPIPEALNVTGNYLIAPLKDGQNAEQARAFVAFLRSPQGQSILREFGFLSLRGFESE